MSNPKALSITLPQDLADMVEAKVKSGEFENESAVVAEGLRVIADHDLSIEKWLVDEVVPTYDAMTASPQTALTAEETWLQLEQHMGIRGLKKTAV